MFKLIILAALIGIIAILIYAASRPNKFRIERSTLMAAPPEAIFAQLNDFHAWEAWSPWEKIDPAVKRTYSGADAGVGAKYRWDGNKQLGSGSMTIIESTPHRFLKLDIDFRAPFAAHNTIEFILDANGDSTAGSTKVTHAMYGPSPFISKLFGLVFNMEKMVGEKFEEGFVTIKSIVETPKAPL